MNIIERVLRKALSQFSRFFGGNGYTQVQRWVYRSGTSDHEEHNSNPNYWNHLLALVTDDSKYWRGRNALDFGCGRGRNVRNLLQSADWNRVDGIDLSKRNIEFCRDRFRESNSQFFVANGTNLRPIQDEQYDFVMSTITLQHIPVFGIRDEIFRDILRVLKPGGGAVTANGIWSPP